MSEQLARFQRCKIKPMKLFWSNSSSRLWNINITNFRRLIAR